MKLLVISPPDQMASPLTEILRQSPVRLVQSGHGHSAVYASDSPEQRIHRFHAKLLSRIQKTWYQYLPSDKLSLDDDEVTREIKEITALLDRHESWVVQDPLLACMLPAWLKHIDDAEVLLHYNEPLDCALALKQKWRFPVNFGLALWEQYVLMSISSLQGKKSLRLSSKSLGRQPNAVLSSLMERLGGDVTSFSLTTGSEESGESMFSRETLARHADFLQDSQRALLQHLEAGELDRIADRELSLQSQDILDTYGRLRAGFDRLRDERDEARDTARKALTNGDQDITGISAGATADVHEPVEDSGSPDAFCRVTVHIRDQDPVEFLSDVDSPILQMLQQAMQTAGDNPGQLLYLELQDEETCTLYFVASDLLGIETTPKHQAST